MEIKVSVPATSANLGPGFDSIGLALQIYNELTLSVAAGPHPAVEITGEGAGLLPEDGSHLSLRAADALFEAAGLPPPIWRLRQHNRIPPASGLGSSAAAIVGGLFAANAFLPEPFSREQLLELAIALEGHPDNVAPALCGGMVICGRDHERWRTLHALPAPGLRLLLALPESTFSTAGARRVLPEQVPRSDAVFNLGRAAALTAALITGDEAPLSWACEDRLHQPYRLPLIRGAGAALEAARRAGAGGAALSGAGPSIIALWFERGASDPRTESVAAALRDAFSGAGNPCRIISTTIDRTGATRLD
ncbi:MAG: homoserine kinase [Firmicutes bacterium]|nr:homoserine kinase [Bacillota bacterium]